MASEMEELRREMRSWKEKSEKSRREAKALEIERNHYKEQFEKINEDFSVIREEFVQRIQELEKAKKTYEGAYKSQEERFSKVKTLLVNDSIGLGEQNLMSFSSRSGYSGIQMSNGHPHHL